MIYFHKIIPLFVSPLFVFITFCVLSLWLRKKWFFVVGFSQLIFMSFPFVSNVMWSALEADYRPFQWEDRSLRGDNSIDAIVVLSGMLGSETLPDGTTRVVTNGSMDRFFVGVDLFKDGLAPVLIFTSGQLPWQRQPESVYLSALAIEMGVPPSSILITEVAQNTHEEAVGVRALLEDGSTIALVTSAFHMPRATHIFENYGLVVEPVPVNFRSSRGSNIRLLDLIPTASALSSASAAIREYIGIIYYRLFVELVK